MTTEPATAATEPGDEVAARPVGKLRRPATIECGWCGTTVAVPTVGRVPLWCGQVCRHRAWEQNRAAQSGRSATKFVERIVTIEVTKPAPVPDARTATNPAGPLSTQPTIGAGAATAVSGAATAGQPPRGAGWIPLLDELTRQIDTGRVYGRDLNAVTEAINRTVAAVNRRRGHR